MVAIGRVSIRFRRRAEPFKSRIFRKIHVERGFSGASNAVKIETIYKIVELT